MVLGLVSAGKCEDAGYQCFDMSCSAGYQEVTQYSCPSLVGNRPEKCCKEVIDMRVTPEIILNKAVYETGDTFSVQFKLPYLSDCSYYIISPSGQEASEGGGGCGINPSFSNGDIGIRLGQLFGNVEYGTYKVKIIAKKSGYSDIVKEKEFQYVQSAPREDYSCTVSNGDGYCNFLDGVYQIKHKGCNDNIDLDITYAGKTESFKALKDLSEITLKNTVKIKLSGTPCAVYQTTLAFKKDIDIFADGTYTVKENTYIKMNEVYGLVREITPLTVYINGNNAQVCNLNVGDECKIYYGPVEHPRSKNLKIVLNSINGDTASITVTKILEVIQIEPTETSPTEIKTDYDEAARKEQTVKVIEIAEKDLPKDKVTDGTIVLCSGCELDNKCYPFGFRKDKNYCDDKTSTFISQKIPDTACENSFECNSNLCIDNKCVSGSVWAKFMRWFGRLFGSK